MPIPSMLAPGPLPLLLAAALGGCQTAGNHVVDVMTLRLQPGDTGVCYSAPCQVYLALPPGTGRYVVTGNGIRFGAWPAGQTALLGGLWDSQVIRILGAEAPPTYVHIGGTDAP